MVDKLFQDVSDDNRLNKCFVEKLFTGQDLAHSKYRTISSITKDVLKEYYNLRTKGEFVQELYYNREFQIMYSSSTLLFILL